MTFSRDEVNEHADLLEDMSKGVVMNYHPVLSRAMARAAEMLRELSTEADRAIQPDRCPWAKAFDTLNGKMTSRCKKNVTGHGKIHHARGFDEFPMMDLYWHPGDPDEFQSTRNDFYAWRE